LSSTTLLANLVKGEHPQAMVGHSPRPGQITSPGSTASLSVSNPILRAPDSSGASVPPAADGSGTPAARTKGVSWCALDEPARVLVIRTTGSGPGQSRTSECNPANSHRISSDWGTLAAPPSGRGLEPKEFSMRLAGTSLLFSAFCLLPAHAPGTQARSPAIWGKNRRRPGESLSHTHPDSRFHVESPSAGPKGT
jgi:hypothetical protein